jgi:hypothetical protein
MPRGKERQAYQFNQGVEVRHERINSVLEFQVIEILLSHRRLVMSNMVQGSVSGGRKVE